MREFLLEHHNIGPELPPTRRRGSNRYSAAWITRGSTELKTHFTINSTYLGETWGSYRCMIQKATCFPAHGTESARPARSC